MNNLNGAGFNKKKRPQNSYTELPKPETSFNAENKTLLENIKQEVDVL